MRKRGKRVFLRLSILKMSIFSLSFFIFFSCKNDLEKIRALESDSLPDLIIKEPSIIKSVSGKVDSKVEGPTMKRFSGENPYTEFPDGVFVTFYKDEEVIQSTLSAKYGISKENEMEMEARNDVVIIDYEKGDTIYTEQIIWNQNTDTIRSDKPLKRVNGDNITYGDGFVMDSKTGIYFVPNQRGTEGFEDEQ